MTIPKKLVLLFLSLSFLTSLSAEEFIWVTDDPLRSISPLQKQLDLDASTLQIIIPLLESEYSFKTMVANPKRGFELLKDRENACMGNKIRTQEREQYAYITEIPQIVFPGLRLYINKSSNKYNKINSLANNDGVISLADIFETVADVKLGIADGRSYGSQIDKLLNDPTNAHLIWKRNASLAGKGVVKMLENDRFDLSIEFSNVFQVYSSENQDTMQSYPIQEASQYVLGNIICSKSPQGQALINAFNKAIAKASKTKDYLEAHLKWFDKGTKADAIKYYNEVYNTSFTDNESVRD